MRKNWCWHTLTEWNELILKDITFITWQIRYSCFPRRNNNELTFHLHIQKRTSLHSFDCVHFPWASFSLSTRLAANQILWKPAALSHYCLVINPSFLGAVTFPFHLFISSPQRWLVKLSIQWKKITSTALYILLSFVQLCGVTHFDVYIWCLPDSYNM